MVKVIYAPPPYGPATQLNRPGYGLPSTSTWINNLSRARQGPVIAGAVLGAMVICAIPQMFEELPPTLSPEYKAANRAYMR